MYWIAMAVLVIGAHVLLIFSGPIQGILTTMWTVLYGALMVASYRSRRND